MWNWLNFPKEKYRVCGHGFLHYMAEFDPIEDCQENTGCDGCCQDELYVIDI